MNREPIERELSFGELFNKSIEFATKNYLKVLPIFAAFGAISALASAAITYATPNVSIPGNIQNLTPDQLFSLLGTILQVAGYTLLSLVVTWFILYFASGIAISKMDRNLRQVQASLGKLNYASLAMTTFLCAVIITAGLFLFGIGALIFGTMFYLALSASVIEGKSSTGALGRSRQLVSGRWLKTFALLAVFYIIVEIVASFVTGLIELPLPSTPEVSIAMSGVQSFVTALAFPLIAGSMLALYYSNRAKSIHLIQPPKSPYDDMRPQPLGNYPMRHARYCTKCGVEVSQEEQFCHNCGAVQPAST